MLVVYKMPAGPTAIYYGVALSAKDIKKLVSPETCMDNNDFDLEAYQETLEQMMEKDWDANIYVDWEKLRDGDVQDGAVVVGFKVGEIEPFADMELDVDFEDYNVELETIIRKYKTGSPKLYFFYIGD